MASITITRAKYDELNERLSYLLITRRSEISMAIKTAKEFGDLSENAEYSAAKDDQVQNETEIARIEDILIHATVIDESTIGTKVVNIGNIVTILDVEENEKITYSIVSTLEACSRENKISDQSPIGKALMGRKKGEVVKAITPSGEYEYKILAIKK